MPLSDEQKKIIGVLTSKIRRAEPRMTLLDRYYEGRQRLLHIGLAVPPELRMFETAVNVPRMAVDEPRLRQGLRAFYRAGDSTKEDPALREAWEFNNLGSESSILFQEEKIFGHAFASVGTNPDDSEHPRILVEDPRQIGVDVDPQRRQIRVAFRMYRDEDARVTRGTLYEREATTHVVRGRGGWEIADDDLAVDAHGLGVVPLVMFANRRRAGDWSGVSEMADVIGKTDAVARLLSNMQVGAETHALPSYFITGASKDDFVGRDGKPIPVWESYFTSLKAVENAGAKVWQFQAGDLKNFTDAINELLRWCADELGLPNTYIGPQTVNPASEGGISASESRLCMRVRDKNRFDGDSMAWVMGLEERFRTGEWGQPNSIRTLFFDPETPSPSQIADRVTKLRQTGALSIEGMWDELGWDEARKQQEKARLQEERDAAANDPLVAALARPTVVTPAAEPTTPTLPPAQ